MSILIVVALLVAGLAVFIATRPPQFRVERSALIQAPPAALQAQIEDFHQWPHWSPWAKRDPASRVVAFSPRGERELERLLQG